MGLRGLRTFAFFVCAFPALAFANDWYSEIASHYDRGSIPQPQALGTEKAWLGKCSTSEKRETRVPSVLYVHVDRDPLSGPMYQVVQLFELEHFSSLEKARISSRRLLLDASNLDASLKNSENAKAWVMKLGNLSRYRTLLVRESKISGNDPSFLVQSVADSGARAYCYYYQPLAD